MQNLVLAVQNTVQAKDIGTASASVAFFRSVGGAIGVSVLGAVMANHVKDLAVSGMAKAGIPVQGGGASGASMDLTDMPAPIRDIMRAAYGDATAQIFMISAIIAVLAFVSVLLIKERPLRRTVDATPDKELIATASAEAAMSVDTASMDAVKLGDTEESPDDVERPTSGRPLSGMARRESAPADGPDLDLEFARILTQERPGSAGDVRELQEQLSRTQYVLAEQQLQLSGRTLNCRRACGSSRPWPNSRPAPPPSSPQSARNSSASVRRQEMAPSAPRRGSPRVGNRAARRLRRSRRQTAGGRVRAGAAV